jgi:hypothetical protein
MGHRLIMNQAGVSTARQLAGDEFAAEPGSYSLIGSV